jgi:protein-L-isoaspartate(D-aspartate) O-methyltransferase
MEEPHFAILRRHMVEVVALHVDLMEEELGGALIAPRVLRAMGRVRRHLFVPPQVATMAYHDAPLAIGFGKTISRPVVAAIMTDLLDPLPGDRVLEIGTGLGYQTAVLAELRGTVFSVEIVEEFALAAERRLAALGYRGVAVRVGDGARGWAEHAPFDRILVTAAPATVPPALLEQLRPGGRLVLPLGPDEGQVLTVIDKAADGSVAQRESIGVRFSRLE